MARRHCIGDWYFVEMKAAGKFPPVSLSRKINAFNESVDTVASKYGVYPHIRVIVVNQTTGETFKVGVVLCYKQTYETKRIDFSGVNLSVGADGKVSAREKVTLIGAIFDALYEQNEEFMQKLRRFCYDDLRKIVARQVAQ